MSEEQQFWNGRDVDTYDFERCDQDYDGDSEMARCYLPYVGEYVQSVKYRRDVQQLEAKLEQARKLLVESFRVLNSIDCLQTELEREISEFLQYG